MEIFHSDSLSDCHTVKLLLDSQGTIRPVEACRGSDSSLSLNFVFFNSATLTPLLANNRHTARGNERHTKYISPNSVCEPLIRQ